MCAERSILILLFNFLHLECGRGSVSLLLRVRVVIVCHCMRVRDCEIRRLANQGHASSDDIAEACGAGGCCGGCRPAIDEILREGRPSRDLVFLPMYSEGA